MTDRGLGWIPDLPDIRDEPYTFKVALRRELKPEVARPVRALIPWRYTKTKKKDIFTLPVKDQLQTSSCTGQSTKGLIDSMSGWVPRSALELYWFGRDAIGETDRDDGAYIRDVIKGAATHGAGTETLWPFDERKVTVKPSNAELLSASRHKIGTYHRLETRDDFQSCLAEGYGFVIGFTCYDNFVMPGTDAERYGILNMPIGSVQGGHAVFVIGYDNSFHESEWAKRALSAGVNVPNSVYLVRNSWGPDWGYKGNFAVDAQYFENTNLADDAWTVRIR